MYWPGFRTMQQHCSNSTTSPGNYFKISRSLFIWTTSTVFVSCQCRYRTPKCPVVWTCRTNQRLATAHRTCAAPQRLCRLLMLPLPWQRTESVGSCVSQWRGRWRRALPGTVRPVCKPLPRTRASFPAVVRTAGSLLHVSSLAACARAGSERSSSPQHTHTYTHTDTPPC